MALALTGCRPHDFPQYPANYREYAYVTNGASGTVTVLDVVNVRLDRELAVGQNPVAVAASPSRNEVYVVNSGTRQSGLGLGHQRREQHRRRHHSRSPPAGVDRARSAGNLAYVANSGSNTISVLDLKARREIAVIGAGEEPVAARISPDGKTLVVANRARQLGQHHRCRSHGPPCAPSLRAAPEPRTWSSFPTPRRPSSPALPATR